MGRIKLHLADHGQDFTWFVVEGGRIVECGPFQGWAWEGRSVANLSATGRPKRGPWRPGDQILLVDADLVLNYPVVAVSAAPAGLAS